MRVYCRAVAIDQIRLYKCIKYIYTMSCNVKYLVTLSNLLPLQLARSDANAAFISWLRPGQRVTRIPATAKQGESLQAKIAGVPGGPAETSTTCSEASDQGEQKWTSLFSNYYMKKIRSLSLNCALSFHKVLQYKKRCGELEEQVLEKTSDSEKMRLLVCVDCSVTFKNQCYIDIL